MAVIGANSAVGTEAVQLTETVTPLTYGIHIKASLANSGNVYVGLANTVTAGTEDATDGYELDAGEEVLLPRAVVTDASEVWLIGSGADQHVHFIAY